MDVSWTVSCIIDQFSGPGRFPAHHVMLCLVPVEESFGILPLITGPCDFRQMLPSQSTKMLAKSHKETNKKKNIVCV